jgi:hypothetical protein
MGRKKPPRPPGTFNPRFKKRREQEHGRPEAVRARPDQRLKEGIPKSHYELIGAVIAQWSRMEGVIQELIWKFLNLSLVDGRIVTCQNDVSQNIAILRAILKRRLHDSPLLPAFNIRLNRLTTLMSDRNLLAHGLWGTSVPEDVPGVLSLRRKAPDLGFIVFDQFSEDYLRKLVKAIDDEKTAWKGLLERASPEPPVTKGGK